MNKKLVIIGAGGHGKVIADLAVKNGYSDICFVDDNTVGEWVSYPIVGCVCDVEKLADENTEFVIGIGNNKIRKMIAEKYSLNWAVLVHPSAQLGIKTSVGAGTVVMANAVVNADTTIGEHCIINTSAVVEHDNVIGDYVHISPKATLGGTVHIGDSVHVGIGATVIHNIDICSGCVIGAGAVVVKNIDETATYVGVPAKACDVPVK